MIIAVPSLIFLGILSWLRPERLVGCANCLSLIQLLVVGVKQLVASQKADFSNAVQVDFLNWLNQQDGVPVLIFGTSDISVSVDNILITLYIYI